MSKKDDHTGLSSEDADLWERVTRTLSSFGSTNKGKKRENSSSKSKKISQSISDTMDESGSADQTEFATLLAEQEKSENSNHFPPAEDELKNTPKKPIKKSPKPSPTREDFAALLDNPNAVISTDSAVASRQSEAPEKSAVAAPVASGQLKRLQKIQSEAPEKNPQKPLMPAYSPASDQKQNKNSKPSIESFNQRDARNISSGKQTIDAAIDLHGLTQAQAETALKTFLKRAHLDNKRTVLVITGKGQRRETNERSFELGAPEPGIIKRSVPNWLDDMPDVVLSYTTSHSRHGGEGALYVRLRRFSKPTK